VSLLNRRGVQGGVPLEMPPPKDKYKEISSSKALFFERSEAGGLGAGPHRKNATLSPSTLPAWLLRYKVLRVSFDGVDSLIFAY